MGYNEKSFTTKDLTLQKLSDPSSSSTAQKGLNTYFVLVADNGKVLNQSEPQRAESQFMKKQEPKILN